MMERLLYRLDLLTRRERVLLTGLVWIALPLAVGFLVVAPLAEAHRAAVARAADAAALHRWVLQQASDLPAGALSQSTAPEPDAGPIGISRLEQSLVTAGLRQKAVRLANRSQNGVEIGFDLVSFEHLLGWAQSMSPGWGYQIREFRLERSDTPGQVSANLVLEARQ